MVSLATFYNSPSILMNKPSTDPAAITYAARVALMDPDFASAPPAPNHLGHYNSEALARFWIMTVFVISSGHFPRLDVSTLGNFGIEYPEGVILPLNGFWEQEESNGEGLSGENRTMRALNESSYSILERLRELGYTHVRIDADGITFRDLKVFDW